MSVIGPIGGLTIAPGGGAIGAHACILSVENRYSCEGIFRGAQIGHKPKYMTLPPARGLGLYHGYQTEIANHCLLGEYGVASQVVIDSHARPVACHSDASP